MKILVVEDDRAVAQSLQLLLNQYHYAVDIAVDGEAALQMADAFEYHLVLLDVLLPRLDGIEVCRQLRKKGFRHPILLLTGQAAAQQKTLALNTGADDYVVKPFDNDELMARIQALLRRGTTAGEPILTWDHVSLDPNTRRVAYRDQIVVLTPKECAILELLLRHQETVFNARAILDLAWSSLESPGEEAVRCHIKQLRQKLMAAGAPKDLIKTVYRVGYRLNPFYGTSTVAPADHPPNAPQVAELRAVNEALRIALEQLQSTQTELQQRNQELEAAYQTITQEWAELEASVAERRAGLQTLDGPAPRLLPDALIEAPTAQLQRLNQEFDAFAQAISHDLKTPLHHISSFAQQLRPLLDSPAADASASRSTMLDIILRSANAAEARVNQLLDFSRIGQAELRVTQVSMQQLVQQVQTELQTQLEGRTICWQVAALPSVMGDPALLRRVWQNLLSNAVKYSRDRPIADIAIEYHQTNTEDIFMVRDNGIGFDLKYANRLFNLFQRLHPQEAFAGNGVGLATVRRIIHRHGGRTWAKAEVDRGATFYFSLPRSEELQ